MPVWLIPAALGAVVGGGTVWVASDSIEKVGRGALLGAAAFLIWKKLQ